MNGAPERREERQEYGIPRRSRRLRGESLLLPGARGAGEDAVHLGSAKIQSSSAASDHEQCTAKARRTARARHSTSLPCRLRGESLLLPGARGAGEDAVHLGSAKIQSSSAASDHEQRTAKARRTARARHCTSLPWHLRGGSLTAYRKGAKGVVLTQSCGRNRDRCGSWPPRRTTAAWPGRPTRRSARSPAASAASPPTCPAASSPAP